MKSPRFGRDSGSTLIAWGVLVLFTLVVIAPIFWALSTSLKPESEVITYPPKLVASAVTTEAYRQVVTNGNFLVELSNSMIYATGSVLLAILVAIPAGYAAARMDFRGKDQLMLFILIASMVPGVALLVPTYVILDRTGLLNNTWIIILLSSSRLIPTTVWFMEGFIKAVPRDLEEAALVDGASRVQSFTKVVLPLIKPGIGASFILGFILVWNEYITVAAFAPELGYRTLQVALVNQIFDSVGVTWSYVMAFAIVSSMPVVVMFLLVQRWFVAGLTAGAVKG